MSSRQETVDAAGMLRVFAEHFEEGDWAYTRDTGKLKHIRYVDDFTGYDHPARRAKRALLHLLGPTDHLGKLLGVRGPRARWAMFKAHARNRRHMPDGVLNNGGVIVFWEENGEYLDLVQPSVGSLIADWLEAEPDNPHAQKVAAEMNRHRQSLLQRAKESGWGG